MTSVCRHCGRGNRPNQHNARCSSTAGIESERKMAEKRTGLPYIWVTWLTKLLTGEASCEWAGWFQAQHDGKSWTALPGDFDSTTWQIEHTAARNKYQENLEDRGFDVSTETQNYFHLKGRTATVGGKPDLIARKQNRGIIADIKTGQPRSSDHVQVMLYMYAVPRAFPEKYRDVGFEGRVVYGEREVPVPSSAIDDKFVERFADLIRRLASENPARLVPSFGECRFCKIPATECPDRVEEDTSTASVDDF